MTTITLHELIHKEAEVALVHQSNDGSFSPGHNGPYYDQETPARNTSHWLFTFSALYEMTGEYRYKVASLKALDYLLSDKLRPMGKTFWCRKNPEKDFTNGLIGQAWIFESLIKAYHTFGVDQAMDVVKLVYKLHPWDDKNKLWRTVNIEGSYGFDYTFNHHLWFAAVAGKIEVDDKKDRTLEFVRHHMDKLILYPDGVIYHNTPIYYKQSKSIHKNRYINYINYIYNKRSAYYKSVGYHGFNLYALAMIIKQYDDINVINKGLIDKLKKPLFKDKFINVQNDNIYSYPYNPTGIENAFFLETLGQQEAEIKKWLNLQFTHTNTNDSCMTGRSNDSKTSKARIYEALRLENNYEVQIS